MNTYDDLHTAVRLVPEVCKRKDARWAICEACESLLTPFPTTGKLATTLYLHSNGSCAEPQYTFYRIAEQAR